MRYLMMLMLMAALAAPSLSSARSQDAALALSVDPGVFSILNGNTATVAPKMEVPIRASVKSDATGRAQLIFPDDATLTVSPGSEIELAEFVDTPKEENILLNLSVGAVRIITGDASRRNPSAFTVETPQATIGIRGTMVTIETSGEITRIYLSETSGKGITVRNKYTGKVMDMRSPGLLVTIGPLLFDERKATRREATAFNAMFRRPPARAAAPAKKQGRGSGKLIPQGDLPFTTGINVAQLDEVNRAHEINSATVVALAGGSGGGNQGNRPGAPSAPVIPPGAPSSPSTPFVPNAPPSTPSTPSVPDAPSTNPSTPTTPDAPSTNPSAPSTPNVPPSTPSTPSVPDAPSTNPSTPSTPDTPTVPDVPPAPPDTPNVPPVEPDNPVVPPDTPSVDNYRITLPELAGNFAGSGTFNYYEMANPGAGSFSGTGAVSFTVPRTYTSLSNDTYTIELTNVKVPGFSNGAPVPQGPAFGLPVNVNRQTGAISQVPGNVISTQAGDIRGLLMKGAFNDNRSGVLDTVHTAAGTNGSGQALRGVNAGPIAVTKQ